MKRTLIVVGLIACLVVTIFVLASKGARSHRESVQCGTTMISLNLSARQWSFDNEDRLPSSFQMMSNVVRSLPVLVCPGDHSRQPAVNWATFTAENSSYEIVKGGLVTTNAAEAFFRCKVHGMVAYSNGLVFDGKRKVEKVSW
jgi:hypothetical protein